MHAAPTVSRIFADRYRREATRLERLHCNHLSPGTATWGDALEAMEKRMGKLDGPIKRTAAIKAAGKYLRETQKGSMHYMLGSYGTKRSSVMSFATINFGAHPLLGVSEDGVSIMKHTTACRRDGSGWTSANRSLGYISRHAVQRLHERGGDLTIERATKMFTCIGMLGHLFWESESIKHIEGTMSIQIEDLLATGALRHAVGMEGHSRNSCVFFEVRTFLPVSELENRPAMVEQGRTAMEALYRWADGDRDPSKISALIDRIPVLPGRDDDFILQAATKVRIDDVLA